MRAEPEPEPELRPGRNGMARRPWSLLREGLLWSAPTLLALALLGLFERIDAWSAVLGWAAALAAAFYIARGRLRELEAIAAWIEGLSHGQERPPLPEEAEGTLAHRLLRPVGELGRELRRQSRRMADQQRMLASLIEALPDPVLLVDRTYMVVQANGAAQRTLDPALPPVPLARVLRDPGILAAVGAALAGGAPSSVTFSPTLDRAKQFSARIEPVELGEGGRGVLIALREQTEQVMIERMRSDFVANASHEIRTPLASIQGFIETLRGPARDDPAARDAFLEIMAEEAARMRRLVDDLLSLSRIELAAHQPPTELCDMGELLQRVAAQMRPQAEQNSVTLELALAAPLPPVIADADQLHQLFANLIDNAIKYGGAGKVVRIAARFLIVAGDDSGPLAGRACVRVEVEDQGPGIAREHLPRLTERFYRVDSGRSRRLRGTGLGLAIVKHILRRHQGHLAVDSEPGQGSRFIVSLPADTRA